MALRKAPRRDYAKIGRSHLNRAPALAKTRPFMALQGVIERSRRFVATPYSAEVADPLAVPFKDRLRVAVVSFPMKLKSDFRSFGRRVLPFDSFRLKLLRRTAADAIAARVESLLAQVIDEKPDLVCVHELGCPYADRDARRAYVRRIARLFPSSPYVFAGSFHCGDSLYNRGVFFAPDGKPGRKDWDHVKMTSATTLGERVRVPSNRRVRMYSTAHGRIGIFVCLDSYDATQALACIAYNFQELNRDHMSMLVVPSFGMEPDKFRIACAELSLLMANIVVVPQSGERSAEQWLFVCGEPQVPRRRVGNDVSVFEIEAARYARRRAALMRAMPPEIAVMFRRRFKQRLVNV